ncbi:GNAT family N-acetyltransferase [archaeon]|nr:GNAT family N-acetyltransferase [archaeon]
MSEQKISHVGKKKIEVKLGEYVNTERLIAGKPRSYAFWKNNPSKLPYKPFGEIDPLPIGSKGFIDFQHDEKEKMICVAAIAAEEQKGIGSKLLKEVEGIAKKRKCKLIKYFLDTHKNKRAIRMLKRNGYELSPEWKKYENNLAKGRKEKKKLIEFRKKL